MKCCIESRWRGTFCIQWNEEANCFDDIFLRDYFLKHVIEGKIEGTGRNMRRERYKQLLNELKEKTRYWNLKGEAPYILEEAVDLPQVG
jgi:hypothetical protein